MGNKSKQKTKTKSTRSINSGSSKNSGSTRMASNLSAEGTSPNKTKKGTRSPPPLPPGGTPEPVRQRKGSDPVDLDELADALGRQHHRNDPAVSPAETFDTVPLDASPSRSFDSRSGGGHVQGNPTKARDRDEFDDDDGRESSGDNYLPVSLLNFDSPSPARGEGGKNNSNSNSNNKIVIEHTGRESRNKKSFGARAPVYFCLAKPVLLILLLLALAGGASTLYGWLLRFPSLNKQVQALEEQVLQLTAEVDRLETENDRYTALNNQLNSTVDDLEDVRDDLNGTVSDLEDVADALNTTKDQVVAEVKELRNQNSEYARLNEGLREQVSVLGNDLDRFRASLEDLSSEHAVLKNTTDALRDLAGSFANTTVLQNETLVVLRDTLEGYRAENDRLEGLNDALEAGLAYLNQTLSSNGLQIETSAAALSEITTALGEQVLQQQWTTLRQLEISYRQVLAGWDCDYRDVFRFRDFGQDFGAPILGTTTTEDGALVLPRDLREYLEERVFSRLCLNGDAFSRYLFEVTVGEGRLVTSNELVRAVVLYTEDALLYYFPLLAAAESNGNGNEGVVSVPGDGDDASYGTSLSEWIGASFRCDLLEFPFVGTAPSGQIDVRRRNLGSNPNPLRLRGGPR